MAAVVAPRPANAPEWLFPDIPREEADGLRKHPCPADSDLLMSLCRFVSVVTPPILLHFKRTHSLRR